MLNNIAIIGYKGEMGKLFSEQLTKQNINIIGIDSKTPLAKWQELLAKAEMVIVSVPIEKAPSVLKKLSDKLAPHQILSDFTSVKKNVVPQMLLSSAKVISAHPMFGKVENFIGQKIILLPVRCESEINKVSELYKKLGLKVHLMEDWQKHDSYMSIIQGLFHFSQITFLKAIREQNLNLKTLLSICSPVYLITFAIACRIITRNPELYMHILMDNPENNSNLKNFISKAEEQFKFIEQKQESTFLKDFEESKQFLKSELAGLSEISDFLIKEVQKKK